MSGSYLGGNTVITVRRSAQDMERRKAHWRRKLAREQRVLSTGARITTTPRRGSSRTSASPSVCRGGGGCAARAVAG
jgi:hypothetical protein